MDETSREALAVKADSSKVDQFIGAHKGFIISCAYRTLNHYVTEQDDAYAIALTAFHEAIGSYDGGKGEFLPFAGLIIKRRLVDDLRRQRDEVVLEPETFEGTKKFEESSSFDKQASAKINEMSANEAACRDEKTAIREEIAEAQALLAGYGFSFFDLIEVSPKSKKTREVCRQAIICVLRPGEIYEKMKKTKQLPIKELVEASGVPRKKIERHRKYIMAVAELLTGDFPHLNEYLRDIRKELM